MQSRPEMERRGKAAFAPEVVDAINRAYARALDSIGGDQSHGDRRAALAKHIMDLARSGEADEVRLSSRALALLMNGAVDRRAG